MNLVRPAGTVPAGPFHLKLNAGRAGLFACAGVLAALNAEAGQIINELTFRTPLDAIRSLAGVSAVIWFAMYAALKIGFESDAGSISKRDGWLVAAMLALCFLPFPSAAKAALLFCPLYLFATSKPGDHARRVDLVLFGLTGPLIWGPLILESFAGPLLSLDAHVVGALIGTNVDGNVVQFANSARSFLIGIRCSSAHNISIALVLWTTVAALFQVRFDLRYFACGIAMVAFMFGLNVARLSAIGLFPSRFDFLHDGAGSNLFGWGALVGAGMLAFFGVDSAVRRQR